MNNVVQLSEYRASKTKNHPTADAVDPDGYPQPPTSDEKWAADLVKARTENFKFAKAAHDTNLPPSEQQLDWAPVGPEGGRVALRGAMRAGDTLVTTEGSISINHPSLPPETAANAPAVSHDDIA